VLANRELIEALRGKLVAWASNVERMHASLNGRQTKIWINEREPGVEEHLADAKREINYAPWLNHADVGCGLSAPHGRELVVYGGFISKTGEERLNPYKEQRAQEIHETGWS
jgi:hypothetical protein